MSQHDFSGSVLIAAGVALVPDYVMNYAGKLLSVFVLAVAAEIGRRLVNMLWRKP